MGNGATATALQCSRQCFQPPLKGCGGTSQANAYGTLNPIAVLDPLNCMCVPTACAAHTADLASTNHQYVNAAAAATTHYPSDTIAGYNTIDVQCIPPAFEEFLGHGSSETINCGAAPGSAWTTPTNICRELGCKNPRLAPFDSNDKSGYAIGMKLDHTCASKDAIKLPEASIFSDVAGMLAALPATLVYTDGTSN